MSLNGMGEAMVVEGATDAQVFETYIEHFLAPPTLEEGQVVLLNNLTKRPSQKDKGAN